MLSEFNCCDCCGWGEKGSSCSDLMSDSCWQNSCSACKPMTDQTYITLKCFQRESFNKVSAAKTQTEREGGVLSNQPLSGETYSGACIRPCSTPLSRNCCGCQHSPRIWSVHTSSGSRRSASGAWRHGRGRSQPPGYKPLPGDSLLDHPTTRGSTQFQSQL